MHLQKFYNRLQSSLIKKYKKDRNISLLIWFLDIKSNDRFRLMKESSIKNTNIPREVLDELESGDLIRSTDIKDEYVITGKGVWKVESDSGLISEKMLVQTMDEKYFNPYLAVDKSLSDKHKIVILSMMAARAFSIDSAVDLKVNESTLDAWEDIIRKTYILLKELGIVKQMMDDLLFGKKGNEHKVSNVYRHTDALPKQTKGFFIAGRNQRYYLDLFNEGKESRLDDIRSLFRLIFGDKHLTVQERDKICSFCEEIATTKNIYIFDVEKHKYHNPKYGFMIRDALLTL